MRATDGNRNDSATRRRRGRPLALYLAAIASVPVIVVLFLSGRMLAEQRVRAGHANDLRDALQELTELGQLRFNVARERSMATTIAESLSLGYGPVVASMALGTDLGADLRVSADAVDRSRAAVDADPQLDALLDDARAARQQVQRADPNLDPDDIAARYEHLELAIRARSGRQLRSARELANQVTGTSGLQATIGVLDESLRFHDAMDAQITQLFTLLQAASVEQVDATRIAMARSAGQSELSLAKLRELSSSRTRVSGAVETIDRSEAYATVRAAIDQTISQPPKPTNGEIDALVWSLLPVYRSAAEIGELDKALVDASIVDAFAQSHRLEQLSTSETALTLSMSLGAVLITAGGLLVVGRRLRRPLQRLEAAAMTMLSGATAHDPLSDEGPRELRVVARAMNEFAVNLGHLEKQADALARADLDDLTLAAPVTGSLGRSLRLTFARLADAIGEQTAMQERLAHDATHDPLTGLLNRAAALDAVAGALARAERSGDRAAVLFIDLDGFKQVNDLYGHAVGDEVLRCAVERLRAVSRVGDTVARLGGDEFLIVAEQVSDVREAVVLGERVVAALSQPMIVGEVIVVIGASVGIATGNQHTEVDLVVADADLAVYQAKAAGKGQVELYHPGLRNELTRRSALESDLRAALHDGSLELHYQPVADADGRAVRSVEALLRWNRNGHGRVPPAEFIPVAEASALINDLGRWVLGRAAQQLAVWSSDPAMAELRVAVNVSARHLLARTFVHDVRNALDAAGVPAARLIIEVTETALLADLELAGRHLRELQALGVGVALDDFGTGHTSFTQLRHLPIDTIKIDRSYIATLSNPADNALTRIMADIAHVLGVGVVAEGVERSDQLEALPGLGCGQAQGYLICPPVPPDELTTWIHGRGAPAAGGAVTFDAAAPAVD
ncbi:MAG: EAL domain-containing protein [Acidimicrobiales bacterium]